MVVGTVRPGEQNATAIGEQCTANTSEKNTATTGEQNTALSGEQNKSTEEDTKFELPWPLLLTIL